MTRQQRVLVFLLALVLLAGLGTLAVMMFREGTAPSIGPGPSSESERAPAPPSTAAASRERAPLPQIVPGDSTAIKPKPFTETDVMAVSGFVRDERDAPVEGALCELFEDASPMRDTMQEGESQARQRTESTGAFWFDRNALPHLDHLMIKVRHPSFATARKPIDARSLAAAGIVIVLKSGTRVSGRVGTAQAIPLPAATVTVYDSAQGAVDPEGSVETSATADASGGWTTTHVTAGTKRIVASAPGFATAGKPIVEVVAGAALDHVDFELRVAGGISGRVSTSEGAAIEGLYLTARPLRIKTQPDAAQQAAGDREKEPPKDADGGNAEGDGESERARARAKALPPSKPPEAFPPAGPAQPGLLTLSARTGADGRYSMPGAEIGTYVISVTAPGFVPHGAITVESPAQNVDFVLTMGARIFGQVVDADTGRPVPKFKIGLAGSPDQVVIVPYTKRSFGPPKFQDGRFELREFSTSGRLWLLAEAPGYAPGRSEEIAITQGERREGVVIRLARGATVKGRVLDARGEPVVGAVVALESGAAPAQGPPGAQIFQDLLTRNLKPDVELRTDSQGRFAIPNVMQGSYVVTARHDAFSPNKTQPFAVPPTGETAVPDLVLARGASIRGRVRLKDGLPDTEAMVQVSPAAGGAGSMASVRTVRTDAEGRFEVAGLAVGQYRVSVVQRAGKPDLGPLFSPPKEVITLTEGESREIDL